MLPALARSPQQLARANAVRGMLDSLSTLGGPLAASSAAAASGPSAVFVVCAAASLFAGLVVVGLPYDAPPREADPDGAPGRAVLQGFAAIAGVTLGFAVGGLLSPLLIDGLGVRGALVAVGVLAPVAVVVSRPALRRLNAGMRVRDADRAIAATASTWWSQAGPRSSGAVA